jgi:hypothetical protein
VDVTLSQNFKKEECLITVTVDNKQFIKDWIEKKLQGQGNPLDDLDPKVTFVIPGSKTNPIFGTFAGIAEVENFFSLLQAKLLEKGMKQTFKVTDCIAEGDRVLALIEESFTQERPNSANGFPSNWLELDLQACLNSVLANLGFPPAPQPKEPSGICVNQTAWFFRLTENQKIIYLYTYDDTLVTSEALS